MMTARPQKNMEKASTYAVLFFAFLSVGCGKPDPVADEDAVKQEIEQLNETREMEGAEAE